MNNDYIHQGVLRDNYRTSAALTRQRLRENASPPVAAPASQPVIQADGDAEIGAPTGISGPTFKASTPENPPL